MPPPPITVTLPEIRRTLATGASAPLLLPDAVLLSMATLGRTGLTAAELAEGMRAFGLRVTQDPPLAAFTSPGAIELRDERLRLAPGYSLGQALADLLVRLRTPPPPRGRPPKSPASSPAKPSSGKSAAKPTTAKSAAKPAAAKAATPPKPGAPARRAPSAGPARDTTGSNLASLPFSPAPPSTPTIPPAPPLAPAPVTWRPLDRAAAAALLVRPPGPPLAFLHAMDAHALAAAEHFEDLLALGTLRGVEPHTWQIEAVRRVLRQLRGRALLADEVGLGKTVEAIMALREYQLRGMVRRTLVVVPPALLGQWQSELLDKAGIAANIPADADAAFWRRDGVILVSQGLARLPRHAEAIQAQAWDLVIVDEAHRYKNRASQSWKLVDGLKSRFLLLLTATPVESDLEELYNLVTLLKPGQLSTLADFRKRHVDARDPTAAKDPARLRALLGEVMVRNTRANCGISLPPRYVTTVATDALPPERALYDAVVAFLRRHRAAGRRLSDTLMLEAGSSPAAVRASVERWQGEGALAEDVARIATLAAVADESAKATALLDILGAHREKILVFTRFRETLRYVEALAARAGVPAAVVHGGLDRAKKDEAFRRFRDDVPLLLCTDVGSEGQNLQHCHVLVNYDLPWNPMVIEQRIGRLHRYGQTEPVRVYNLCAKGTAEERLLDVLDRRVHLFELVVGEMDLVLGNLVEQEDLEERVLGIYATSGSEEQLNAGFDAIADELARARGQLEKAQKLDDALFGREFEA